MDIAPSRAICIVALTLAAASCGGPGHTDAPAEPLSLEGNEVGFWDETLRGTPGDVACKRPCPTAKYVDGLRVPVRPIRTIDVHFSVPSPMCAAFVAADIDVQELPGCRKRLIDGRGLGRASDGAILLTRSAAELVAASSRSNKLTDVALENSAKSTALAASVLVAGAPSSGKRGSQAAGACRVLVSELAAAANPAALGPPLTCLAHASLTDDASDVLPHWPGDVCGMYGRWLGDVCVEGGPGRPFGETPIDERLPEALTEAGARARAAMARHGWTLDSLGLLGCHILRFERGGNMRGLAVQPSPKLRATDVSTHSAGLACDLRYVWVDRGADDVDGAAYSVEMAFWTLADEAGTRDVNSYRQLLAALYARVGRAGGEGAYFRALEEVAPTRDQRSAAVFTIAVVRNALVDAGFIVYTPATNPAHFNHLHFHLPPSAAAWAELANDDTSVSRREELVEAALVLARGGG